MIGEDEKGSVQIVRIATSKRKDDKAPRMVKFTPFVTPVDKIMAQIKDEHYLQWPRPLHSSPIRRNIVVSIRITATTQKIAGT